MREDAITIFCLSHGVSFKTLRSNQVIICMENHVLSNNFPRSGRWFYCCLCQQYWVAPKGQGERGGFSKQCPSCNLIKKARYYSCDQCKVTMIDSLGAIDRKGIHITPWGTPHPHCPGCQQLPKLVPQSHACPELNGLLTTARPECPFCEEEDRVEGVVDKGESRNETEIVTIGSADEFESFNPSYLALEELERKTSEFMALEAEAEERKAKAQERLRQVEARLRQEMSRRSEAERKSREIEEDLRRQSEIDQGHIEAAIKTSEAAARFEEERNARIAAEQAKAGAEMKLLEMAGRAAEAEERLRRIEENYRDEIDWIRAELEEAVAATRRAEENHRDEMARITAEAESRAHQAEANTRQQYQIKVEEAVADAQAAIFNFEEMQKKLSEAEAKYKEMENRTRQAETRSRRLYLILKLSLYSAEQIIVETLNAGDEDEKDAMVIPLNLPTDAYLDDLPSETTGSGANGLMDYEDMPFSERMRALFDGVARAKVPEDDNV